MEEFIILIDKYGVQLIISAIFIYTAFQLITIGINYLKEKAENGEHEKRLEKRNTSNMQVQYLIDEALNETKGDRITIMEYHDSITNLAQLPFCFMSCTYDVYKKGLLPVGQAFQNLSTSLYPIFLKSLHQAPYIILDTENRNSELARGAYELIALQGSTKALCMELQDIKKKSIGYITLKKNTEYTETDILIINNLAARLSSLLSVE